MIVDADIPHTATEEAEENYFISMTDMMVGILFIFIIMLMIFALNYRQTTDQQIEITEDQKRRIEIVEQVARQIDHLQAEVHEDIEALSESERVRAQLLTDIRERLEKENIRVTIDQRNGVLRLDENAVRFASDHSDLTSQAASNVDAIARALSATLPAYSDCSAPLVAACSNALGLSIETVFIEGHTDVTGSDDRNWQLSTERAVNTYRRLVETAPTLKDMKNSEGRAVLSVSGYSSTRPIADEQDSAGYERNRRIDLRFVMETERRKRLEAVTNLLGQMRTQIDQLLQSAPPEASTGRGPRL
ncbi:OmpA family protein [Consotaella salsifontis]|uniref:Flagellar motor protein MotB n=1 Tax=Consotaella salsifontis TaxID=1365950 RepID=A0A1T4S281_9HYPH|nr:OmpA family protein [Consotaella salsifontis]SKA22344.1 Flagellar motor protein MotB [Consotaella salsifontis]